MAYVVTSATTLNRITAPNLPVAPIEYDPRYVDMLANTLRLYFNQVNNLANQLSSASGVIPALTVYKVSTLPSASDAGAGTRAFVSDATATTFASNVAGGGFNTVPVYSNGTDWKIG